MIASLITFHYSWLNSLLKYMTANSAHSFIPRPLTLSTQTFASLCLVASNLLFETCRLHTYYGSQQPESLEIDWDRRSPSYLSGQNKLLSLDGCECTLWVRKNLLDEVLFRNYSKNILGDILMEWALKIGSEFVKVVREEMLRYAEIAYYYSFAVERHRQ